MPLRVKRTRAAKLMGDSVHISDGMAHGNIAATDVAVRTSAKSIPDSVAQIPSLVSDRPPSPKSKGQKTVSVTIKPTSFTFQVNSEVPDEFSSPRRSLPHTPRSAPKSYSPGSQELCDAGNDPTPVAPIIMDPQVGIAAPKIWVAPPVSKLQWRAISAAAGLARPASASYSHNPAFPQMPPTPPNSKATMKAAELWSKEDSTRPHSARTRPNSRGTPNFNELRTDHGHTPASIRTPAEASISFPGAMLAPRNVRGASNKKIHKAKPILMPAAEVINISSSSPRASHIPQRPSSSASIACYDPEAHHRYWLTTPTPTPILNLAPTPHHAEAETPVRSLKVRPSSSSLLASPRKEANAVVVRPPSSPRLRRTTLPVTIISFGPKFSEGLVEVSGQALGTNSIYYMAPAREAVDLGINTIPVAGYRRT